MIAYIYEISHILLIYLAPKIKSIEEAEAEVWEGCLQGMEDFRYRTRALSTT